MTLIKRIVAFLFSLLLIFALLYVTHGHSNYVYGIKIKNNRHYYAVENILEDNEVNNTVVFVSKLEIIV